MKGQRTENQDAVCFLLMNCTHPSSKINTGVGYPVFLSESVVTFFSFSGRERSLQKGVKIIILEKCSITSYTLKGVSPPPLLPLPMR
jgi:hypothetical protein